MSDSDEGPDIRVEVDLRSVERLLDELKPRKVGVSAPDGLHTAARSLYELLESRGLEAVMLLDPTYGFCDLQDLQAEALGLDLVLNLGHYARLGGTRITRLVDVQYWISENRLRRLAEGFRAEARRRDWSTAALFTTSNYARAHEELAAILREMGGAYLIAGGADPRGPLFPWQVTGCMFNEPWSVRQRVDGFAFLGGSRFHAVGIRLATGRPTLLLDPEAAEVHDVEEEAVAAERRAVAAIYRAMEAERFGIVWSTKSGQRYPELGRVLGNALESLGKEVYYYAMTEINGDRLGIVRYVDAFVVLACPRIALDMRGFGRPVLSYPQAMYLLRAMRAKGKSLNTAEVLEMPLWAWVGWI